VEILHEFLQSIPGQNANIYVIKIFSNVIDMNESDHNVQQNTFFHLTKSNKYLRHRFPCNMHAVVGKSHRKKLTVYPLTWKPPAHSLSYAYMTELDLRLLLNTSIELPNA